MNLIDAAAEHRRAPDRTNSHQTANGSLDRTMIGQPRKDTSHVTRGEDDVMDRILLTKTLMWSRCSDRWHHIAPDRMRSQRSLAIVSIRWTPDRTRPHQPYIASTQAEHHVAPDRTKCTSYRSARRFLQIQLDSIRLRRTPRLAASVPWSCSVVYIKRKYFPARVRK